MKPHALLVLFASVCAAAPARGQSAKEPINPDRPGVSNGASTVGSGRLQVEVGGNVVGGTEGGSDLYTLPVTLRCGLGATTELRLESDSQSFQGSEHGVADLFVGGKWNFRRGNPSLGVMARLRLPTGSHPFRQEGVTPDLTLLGNVELTDALSLEANAAVATPRDPDGQGRFAQWTYATTMAVAASSKLQAFAELASVGPDRPQGPRQSGRWARLPGERRPHARRGPHRGALVFQSGLGSDDGRERALLGALLAQVHAQAVALPVPVPGRVSSARALVYHWPAGNERAKEPHHGQERVQGAPQRRHHDGPAGRRDAPLLV